ncbi:MAG: T9SS type A sorting domain-containing protein [Candidatus Cloacimonetes bacterium]|nr:T9SS type A sorting domain-containing protein [Candidatus Cloacimonadota bacterium]
MVKFRDDTNPSAFLDSGKPSGLHLRFYHDSGSRSDDGSLSFTYVGEPFVYIVYAQTPYGLQDAINIVEDGGTIYLTQDFHLHYLDTWYEITEPINLYGKSITIESIKINPSSSVNVIFYEPVLFSDVYGSLTFKNIDLRFINTLAINETSINLDNGHISLYNDLLNNSLEYNFTGNAETLNYIDFCSISRLNLLQTSTLNITHYELNTQNTNNIYIAPGATYNGPDASPQPAIEDEENLPVVYNYELWNFPNPFNPDTNIAFSMASSGHVNIEIYNIRGQKVLSLVNEFYEMGRHVVVWNGRDENGRNVGSGVYLYRMRTDEFTETKRMVLLK